MPKRVEHPIILGIVGDSASGKTTLSAGVAQILGEDRCTVLCTDDYHRYDRRERAEKGLSAIDPRANYLDILEQALRHLREGDPILKPTYDHRDGTFGRPKYVKPKEFVIAEGLLGYTTRGMRDCYDVKIYLDPEEELRVKWKIHRDTTKRGYSMAEVMAQIARTIDPHPGHKTNINNGGAGDLEGFIGWLQREPWVLSEAFVWLQSDLIEAATLSSREAFIVALLERDPALLRRHPPPRRWSGHRF